MNLKIVDRLLGYGECGRRMEGLEQDLAWK
jgi:hypothetical protein